MMWRKPKPEPQLVPRKRKVVQRGPHPIEALVRRDKELRDQLGSALQDIEAGRLARAENDRESNLKWSFHFCGLDKVDRSVGAPYRVHINTPWRHIVIALTPDARLGETPSSSQLLKGFIFLQRHRHQICHNVTRIEKQNGLIRNFIVCPLPREHEGPCYDWIEQEYVDSPQECNATG